MAEAIISFFMFLIEAMLHDCGFQMAWLEVTLQLQNSRTLVLSEQKIWVKTCNISNQSTVWSLPVVILKALEKLMPGDFGIDYHLYAQ